MTRGVPHIHGGPGHRMPGAPDVAAAEQHERQRLSWLLHDHVLQDLLVARQDLLEAGESGPVVHALASVEASIAAVRGAVRGLQPPPRPHADLVTALTQLGDLYSRHAQCSLTVDVEEDGVGEGDELLLCVARELIRNAQKHAGADRVWCSVRAVEGGTELEVRDDGHGFVLAEADAAVAAGHIGLASCRARVELVGGHFTVRTGADGTTVTAWLPGAPSYDRTTLGSTGRP